MSELNMNQIEADTNAWLEMNHASEGTRGVHCWADIETTGLDANGDTSRILEIGLLVTDEKGLVVEDGAISFVLHFDELGAIENDIVLKMHTDSGLLETARKSPMDYELVERTLVAFYKQHFGETQVPLSGSSVHFDREWIAKFFPALVKLFHYRNIDISTVKELARIHNPSLLTELEQNVYVNHLKAHRAIPDLVDTITEYRFYIDEFLWTAQDSIEFASADNLA